MEKNRSHMTDRILDLTLEIIYLLIGEECIIAKKSSGSQIMPNSHLGVSQRCRRKQSPKMEPSTCPLMTEIANYKKILEVTKKIIELLTGEVPIRCQDVTVYFSMEEWEYLEGHKDRYEDVTLKNRPPLTSPDGSSNRNTPERCQRLLCSRDSTQQHQKIPQACALYSRDSTQENHEITNQNEGVHVSMKESAQIGQEERCVDGFVQGQEKHVPTDGSNNKNTQQKCLHPLNSLKETHQVSCDDQRERQFKSKDPERADTFSDVLKEHEHQSNIKAEVKEKDDNIWRTDLWKERREHQLNVKVKEDHATSGTNLGENRLNAKAEVIEKEDNIFLRTDLWKDKLEHQWNVKAEVKEKVDHNATNLKTDLWKEKAANQLNVKAEVNEKEDNMFFRTDIWKEKQEHPSNVKEKEDNIFLRTDLLKEKLDHRMNFKVDIKEKEHNSFLRSDLWKEKREHQWNDGAKVAERAEDRSLRTEIQRIERQLNFKTEITERQENKPLGTDVQKEREVSVQTSISRSIPKRCSSPPYQWGSAGEHQKVLQDEKDERLINIKVEERESDDEMYLWRDPMCKEEDVSTDGSNNRNTPERSRSPLYSWDSTPEKSISKNQDERPSQPQAGSRGAPEKHGRGAEISPEIGSDGRYTGYGMDKCPTIFPDGEMEDDVTGDSFDETPIGANFYPIPHSSGQSSGPSTFPGSFHGHLPPVTYRASRRRGETFMCSECGECFTAKAKLFKHQRDHIVDKPHSCPDCGKCFVEKSHLVNHQRSHSVEKPYSCSICGKCFGEKGHLANHEKSHANEKEFFCYDCGKCFTQRGHFNRHQRLHTGEKPYPCPECGKCFPHREYLIRHQRVHAGQKPFPCTECGKCFTDKYDLAKHERIHSGHRPYSCTECGRGFTQKSNLARHIRVHADYNRIHVLTVGNGSPGDPPSSTVSVPTEDERFLYQDMTAK